MILQTGAVYGAAANFDIPARSDYWDGNRISVAGFRLMATAPVDRRLTAARNVLTHIHEELKPGFAFELWDGSVVPEDMPPEELRIAIKDPAVISRLIRRPKLTTLIDLHLAGALDLVNGDLFELVEKRPSVRSREIRSKLKKGLLLKSAAPFLFASGELAGPDAAGQVSTHDDAQKSGSEKQDIAYHYDVSNDFYRLFLDPEMLYTCAYFKDWSNDLATAQKDKLDMICRKLRLKPGDRLLDLGCGWGALVCYAAEHYGVIAEGVTLAEEQVALAQETIAKRGLEGRASVRLQDYKDLPEGTYDKISAIGLYEHVAFANHAAYLSKVHRMLKPRGIYLHHAITRRGKKSEKDFRRKRPEYAALVQYIFPGGEVDHIGNTTKSLEVTGFEVHDVENWREHYARTSELWARNLMANREAAIAEVGEARYRLWVAYLCGVSLGFQRGTILIYQTVATKRERGPSGLPPTRADLYI